MENLGVLALVFVIVLALVVVFYNQAQEIANGIVNLTQQTGVNSNLPINPVAGQQVCNLKIIFTPNLVAQSLLGPSNPLGSAGLGVAGGQWQIPSGASYSWTNCHQYSNLLQMDWTPFSFIGDGPTTLNTLGTISTNDILLSAGQTVHLNLVILGPSGSQRSYTTDPFCTQLCASISIPAGAVYVPKQYTFSFLILNLPRQNYQIQVTSELPINGNSAGVPYLQNVS